MRTQLFLDIAEEVHAIYQVMSNDRKYMGDIFLCPECGDGYMIVKKSRDSENRFFGCTNHKPDGTGCNHVQLL